MVRSGQRGASTGMVNWRARFFWGVEWVYAIIGGGFEAWVYHAYTAPGMDFWLGWAEAITRAVITQVLVVLLAVAAVEMWRSGAHIIGKVLGFASVQVFAVLFAFVAFWLMRVAALAFQQTDILGGALAATLPVPFVGDVPAQELTLDIVAGLPFFQLVINLFAPIITRDHAQPTLEQLKEDAERARLMADLSQARAQSLLTGWVRVGKAVGAELTGRKVSDSPGESEDASLGRVFDSSEESDVPSEGNTPGNSTGSQRKNSRVVPLRPRGKGLNWTKDDLIAYVWETYGQSISEADAIGAIKAMRNAQQLPGVPGTPWGANRQTVKAWADRRYKREGAEVSAG